MTAGPETHSETPEGERARDVRWSGVTFRHAGADPGAAAAVDIPDLRIEAGESVLVCGPSGSGKSSLVRTVDGLIPQFHGGAFTGSVTVGGHDSSAEPLHRTAPLVATVFQNPRAQFFTTDVASEVAFAGENLGRDPEVIRATVDSALAAVGIGHLRGRTLSQLSGGEKQAVACAAAVAQGTPVHCFDEPTANLSTEAIGRFARHLGALRDEGRTLIVVEHRLHFLRGLVDRVVVVGDGRVVADLAAEAFWQSDPSRLQEWGLRSLDEPRLPQVPARQLQGLRDHGDGPGVTLEGLYVRRGSRPVLEVPRCHLRAGAVHAVMGPNGAGKSTLAHAVCGLLPTRRGKVLIDGEECSARRRRRRTALVMQETQRQLFTGSALDEVGGGEAGAQTLERFGLEGLAERHPQSLSGGQMQRLAVAQAVAEDRDVIVLDEPTSGVDLRNMRLVAGVLRELADEGRTVVVVTHDVELVAACADTVLRVDRLGGPATIS